MLTFNFLRPLKKLENVSSIDSILEFLPEDQDYKITVIEKLIETRNRTTTEVVAQKMTPEMIPPLHPAYLSNVMMSYIRHTRRVTLSNRFIRKTTYYLSSKRGCMG